MRKKLMIITLLSVSLMILPGRLISQVKFIEVTNLEEMEEARKLAADKEVSLYVDVYATWCGPCKKMDSDVYTDLSVANYMNTNFINVRMDGELDYGRKFATENNLEGYPSMFIFSSAGEYINTIVGYTEAVDLVETLTGNVENYSVVNKYRVKNEAGELEGEELGIYVNAIRKMGKEEEAEQLALAYMDQIRKKKLSDTDIRVIGYYMTLDATWWPEFSKDPDRLVEVLGDDYMLVIEKIFNRSFMKAIEEENISLISALSNDIPVLVEMQQDDASWLRTLPFLQYYYYQGDHDELIKYVDDRYALEKKDDHSWLYSTASQIIDMDKQYATPAILVKGVEWFQTCIDLDKQFDYYYYHGMVLYILKRKDEAMVSLKAAEILATDGEQKGLIEQVMSFVVSQ